MTSNLPNYGYPQPWKTKLAKKLLFPKEKKGSTQASAAMLAQANTTSDIALMLLR